MCSISGWIAQKPLSPDIARRLSTALLHYGMERGDQSAGVFANNRTLKRAMRPDAFVETKEFRTFFHTPTKMALLHTRMPTCGGIGHEQAQPFRAGNTVSVHNGFYFDVKGIRDFWNLKKPSGIDSELVAQFVNSKGVSKLPDFLNTTDGPSAVAVWHDDNLWLARTGNPTYVLKLHWGADQHIVIFASTADILMSAAKHVWLLHPEHKPFPTREGQVYQVTPKRLIKKFKTFSQFYPFFYPKSKGYWWEDELDDDKPQTEISQLWDGLEENSRNTLGYTPTWEPSYRKRQPKP